MLLLKILEKFHSRIKVRYSIQKKMIHFHTKCHEVHHRQWRLRWLVMDVARMNRSFLFVRNSSCLPLIHGLYNRRIINTCLCDCSFHMLQFGYFTEHCPVYPRLQICTLCASNVTCSTPLWLNGKFYSNSQTYINTINSLCCCMTDKSDFHLISKLDGSILSFIRILAISFYDAYYVVSTENVYDCTLFTKNCKSGVIKKAH